MSKALVLGAAALALSAGTAWAQGYGYGYGYDNGYGYENGYAAPVADLAAPGYGYGYGYAAPVAPAQPGTTIVIVTPGPAPAYTAPPVASGYYGAGVVSQPIYNYAPGYWGGRGYWRRW
jgi:hypothetical protein